MQAATRLTVAMEPTVAATFCATLVDEWARLGVTHAVVAPGSRSTPLALALVADARLAVEVVLDERSAAYTALGLGLATGRPAVLVCTSGTAATHFHGAVVEADLAGVPLLVCTADRPPELQGVGAPQTIDQRHLYGAAVRAYLEPGVPDEAGAPSWRSVAARAFAAATGHPPGPVQLDLAFRDPLVGRPGPLPPGRAATGPPAPVAEPVAAPWPGLAGRSGVILAGEGIEDPAGVAALAETSGWPVLADHRSGCRDGRTGIGHFDGLLRHDAFAAAERPEVVLSLGAPLASKFLSQWLVAAGPERVVVDRYGRRRDPEHLASAVVTAEPGAWCRAQAAAWAAAPSGALDRWRRADDAAERVIAGHLDDRPGLTEPGLVRTVAATLAPGDRLVVASSMPVRDLEWYGPPRTDVVVLANRGANGIDGVTSTAVGVALAGHRTVAVVGDLAFLHDTGALFRLADRPVDLRIVVVDNDGGGIFSFLPQAGLLDEGSFEQLFGTPHRADLGALASAFGLAVSEAGTDADLRAELGRGAGARVVLARTDRAENVKVHDGVHTAVAGALDAMGSFGP
jgi:2-succinyl-5-enolpyruvyl-6-hydroxy-3-cyclohexene-1-carboxylate synthase